MKREWKPGDVAMVKCSDGEWRRAQCEPHPNTRDFLVWRFPDRVYRHTDDSQARPLVILDPEDREQINRLADLFCEARWCHIKGGNTDHCDPLTRSSMRDALAAYVLPSGPPKPDEPTWLGAVVEDADGHEYVRARRSDQPWVGSDGKWRTWTQIDAVHVQAGGAA